MQRTLGNNGVVVDKTKTYTTGTGITPSGDLKNDSEDGRVYHRPLGPRSVHL